MNELKKGLSELVKEAVEQNQPDFDNVLTKKEAEKLIKKYSQQEYFNANDAAKYLGVSITTFWRWRKERKIKSMTFGEITRWKKSDLDEFVEQNFVKGYL